MTRYHANLYKGWDAGLRTPSTSRLQQVLWNLWEDRAIDLGRDDPQDLTGSCKFGALLAQQVYGGRIEATWEHTWVRTPPEPKGWGIIDLTGPPYEGFDYTPDPRFMRRPEFKESLASCAPRVKHYADDLEAYIPTRRGRRASSCKPVRFTTRGGETVSFKSCK